MFHFNMVQNMISKNEELALHSIDIIIWYQNLILKINFYLILTKEYSYGIIFNIIYFNQVNFNSLPNSRLQKILQDLLILIYVYYHLLIQYFISKYYHMMFLIYLNLKLLNTLFSHFLLLINIFHNIT